MKTFFTLSMLVQTATAFGNDQSKVEEFLQNHAPSGYRVFCRNEVSVPECRTLIKFTNNESGETVDAFQISFSAPARPFAATELFLPIKGQVSNGSGKYNNFIDDTMDGMFTVSKSGEHNVNKTKYTLTITDLPFGSMSLRRKNVVLTLNNGAEVLYDEQR